MSRPGIPEGWERADEHGYAIRKGRQTVCKVWTGGVLHYEWWSDGERLEAFGSVTEAVEAANDRSSGG